MIKGLGIDILANDRVTRLKNREEFIRDVFTPEELNIAHRTTNLDFTLARLFSIKEAVLKALEYGLHYGYFWRDIHVDDHSGVKMSGRLADPVKKKSIRQFHFSAAQTKKYALSIVVLESEDQSQEVL
jgi:holo-[acyl-carrier-protein] synthase